LLSRAGAAFVELGKLPNRLGHGIDSILPPVQSDNKAFRREGLMDRDPLSAHRARYAGALALSVLLTGCSSGGSRSGGLDFAEDLARCILSIGLACGEEVPPGASAPQTQTAPPPSSSTFTSWAEIPRDTAWSFNSTLEFRTAYLSTDDGPRTRFEFGANLVQYDAQGRALQLFLGYGTSSLPENPSPVANLSGIGQPWLDYVLRTEPAPGTVFPTPSSPFFSSSVYQVDLVANPYALGWNYQTFGIWDGPRSDFRVFGGTTFGARTPDSVVSESGTATFTGKLGGFYMPSSGVGSLATADISVAADFNTRSLSFTSTNTTLTRDLATSTPAPDLNLSGTLTYGGSNQFTGTLTNAGGTMSGESRGMFYGPSAEELGGAFGLRSQDGTEKFSGAYGAKR
jgi:hypothetical protein